VALWCWAVVRLLVARLAVWWWRLVRAVLGRVRRCACLRAALLVRWVALWSCLAGRVPLRVALYRFSLWPALVRVARWRLGLVQRRAQAGLWCFSLVRL